MNIPDGPDARKAFADAKWMRYREVKLERRVYLTSIKRYTLPAVPGVEATGG